jgi:hypothetical protein
MSTGDSPQPLYFPAKTSTPVTSRRISQTPFQRGSRGPPKMGTGTVGKVKNRCRILWRRSQSPIFGRRTYNLSKADGPNRAVTYCQTAGHSRRIKPSGAWSRIPSSPSRDWPTRPTETSTSLENLPASMQVPTWGTRRISRATASLRVTAPTSGRTSFRDSSLTWRCRTEATCAGVAAGTTLREIPKIT